MLEAPGLADEAISACMQAEWDLRAGQIVFLPLGVDPNSAVYRIDAQDGKAYFLKLRTGPFHEFSVTLPRLLSDLGIDQIIPPLPTVTGQLSAELKPFTAVLYPFVPGVSGYDAALSDAQWRQFGAAVRRIHTASLPSELNERVPQEAFSSRWRDEVRGFLERIEHETFTDPVAVQLAAFLAEKRPEVLDLVERTDQLGQSLRAQPLHFVLCHSDLHAGNLLIAADGGLFIVDWDEPIRAPKERDLMVAGSGLMGGWRSAEEEKALFYRGYGDTQVDQAALAYYRRERIVADIAAFCRQLLTTDEGGEDRAQALRYLMSNFLPGGTIELV